MDLIERRGSSGTGAARLLARWVLLGAVIAAVFALHVLSAESDAGGHGAVPAVTAGHQVPVLDAASTASVTDVGTGPSAGGEMTAWVSGPLGEFEHPGGGEGLLAGCILFLVVAGSGLLLAMLRRRRMLEDGRSAPRGWVGQTRWMKPLPGVPRLELCVIRV